MAKAQFKILIFLVVAGIALGCMAAAYWVYENVILREQHLRAEISRMKGSERVVIDPGAKRFDAATDMIREGRLEDGRTALYKLLQQFPDSARCAEAKRILGEMNLDELFSRDVTAGKKDYIVQPGDALMSIATRQSTTMDLLIRLNGLMSTILHPGDHLTAVPLDFSLVVDVSSKSVTLRRRAGDKDYFFREYQSFDVRLPPNVRVPAELVIAGKTADVDGRPVLATDPRYSEADKWFRCTKSGGTSTIVIRSKPVAKARLVEAAPAAAPARAAPTPPTATAAVVEPPAPESGIFLTREDIDELFALVRNGSKVFLVR